MNLKRTTILPSDDYDLALSIFQSFVQREMMIIMFILGDEPYTRKAVERADNLAKNPYFHVERWVLWSRNPLILKSELRGYLQAVNCKWPYEEIRCFSLSPVKDQAAGILTEDSDLSYIDLQQSFYDAHQQDINL